MASRRCQPPDTPLRRVLQSERLCGPRGRQTKFGQTAALLVSHLRTGFRRQIIIADQVQRAVDHVKQQFVLRGPTELRGGRGGRLGAGDDFAFYVAFPLFQDETQYIRRFVVVEITWIEKVHGRIVDHRQADDGPLDAFLAKHEFDGAAQTQFIDRQYVLFVAEIDLDHRDFDRRRTSHRRQDRPDVVRPPSAGPAPDRLTRPRTTVPPEGLGNYAVRWSGYLTRP